MIKYALRRSGVLLAGSRHRPKTALRRTRLVCCGSPAFLGRVNRRLLISSRESCMPCLTPCFWRWQRASRFEWRSWFRCRQGREHPSCVRYRSWWWRWANTSVLHFALCRRKADGREMWRSIVEIMSTSRLPRLAPWCEGSYKKARAGELKNFMELTAPTRRQKRQKSLYKLLRWVPRPLLMQLWNG